MIYYLLEIGIYPIDDDIKKEYFQRCIHEQKI